MTRLLLQRKKGFWVGFLPSSIPPISPPPFLTAGFVSRSLSPSPAAIIEFTFFVFLPEFFDFVSSDLFEVMDEQGKIDNHVTSAAAFVEGGIQDACDDSCSICLEAFCDNEPSTVTGCKHEFHLQCILEWCQRSSQCPMCWQSISLKDPTSQKLLEGVERERNIRLTLAKNATVFHRPSLRDFELQHSHLGVDDTELEERIIQHLAAAAAMGRTRHLARRDDQRGRMSGHNRPQYLVFSSHSNEASLSSINNAPTQSEGASEQAPGIAAASQLSFVPISREESTQPIPQAPFTSQLPSSAPGPSIFVANRPVLNRGSAAPSSPINQDRPGPSELQTLSESLKSRLNAVSLRYKETISKSTRGWKERLFSRNTSVSNIGSEVRREVNAGIATVSQMIERLDTRDSSNRASASSLSGHPENASTTRNYNSTSGDNSNNNGNILSSESSTSASCAASAGSN